MAEFSQLVATLRAQERELESQLAKIRAARAALESVGGQTPSALSKRNVVRPAKAAGTGGRRRRFSAATRAKMAAAQQARWARKRTEQKK
jgi:hypothetical protein